MFSFAGKVCVVTGAGRGIGRATALAFAEQGADLVLAARTVPELEEVKKEVEARGRRAVVVRTDFLDLDQVRALVDRTVREFGRIDVWVNNHGGVDWDWQGAMGPLIETSLEGWDKVMTLNLKSAFFAAQWAARVMEEHGGGAIVNVTSIDGVSPAPLEACYGAAKAALQSLTAALAMELGHLKIRVNAVAPGLVATKLVSPYLKTEEDWQDRASFYPINRVGQPEDVAAAILFFASDEAEWISGETLLVAGGAKVPSDQVRYLRKINSVPASKRF